MKKKISYLIVLFIFLIPISVVNAAGFSDNTVLSACGFDYVPKRLPSFTSSLYNILKLLVPIILIVMGMLDFAKAMMASDEKKMKDSTKNFINRLIAGVVVFLIMAVVQFVFGQIDTGSNVQNGLSNCMNCILNNKNCGKSKELDRSRCDLLDISKCKGKDSTGVTCKQFATGGGPVCRSVCSTITSMSRCYSTSYCEWSGSPGSGKCSDRKEKDYSPTVNSTGKKVAEYAKKFVGHPYVYGGNKLCENWKTEKGCQVDCSSFVQNVYAKFNYKLPRVAAAQATYNKNKIINFGENYEKLKPGDLLFYYGKNSNSVGHVTMYIGNGEVVHASGSKVGVIISKMSYRKPVWAIRVID